MSRPEVLLVAKLKSMSAVTALVGTRVWPLYRKANTLPAITYEVTGDEPINHSTGTTKTSFVRVSILCFAATYAGVKTLAAAVRGDEAESSPSGISGWTDGNSSIWHLQSVIEDMEAPRTGENIPELYFVQMVFQLGYTQT